MPRVRIYPFSPGAMDGWSGRANGQKANGHNQSPDSGGSDGIRRKPPVHPVVASGSIRPTSFLEALMQATPDQEPLTSSEEVLELAELLQSTMLAVLTEREHYILDALFFEQLSLRELGDRMALSKSQVHRIRDASLLKLRGALSQLGHSTPNINP